MTISEMSLNFVNLIKWSVNLDGLVLLFLMNSLPRIRVGTVKNIDSEMTIWSSLDERLAGHLGIPS